MNKDQLTEYLAEIMRTSMAQKVMESWFRQDRNERKRRLHFVTELIFELAKIKETTTFCTGLAENGIESVIEGDWEMVKEWADHFSFDEERAEIRLSHADVYARFRELLQQCWETRPGVLQVKA